MDSQDIRYVGVDAPGERLFENQYALPRGMSYNSYVVIDRHIALIDSVEAGRGGQWIRQIEHTIGSSAPSYIIVQHMEPDHSASLLMALDRWSCLRIVCSRQAAAMLGRFFPGYDFTGRIHEITDGDILELGRHTLSFISAPMIHWPEVTMTFDRLTHTLFSADAFGKFGARQFDDDWTPEARRYYVNIVGKYGSQVQRTLCKLRALDVSVIAPLHGPELTGCLDPYLDLYDKWSSYRPETEGVLVAYASIYGGTASVAMRLAEMLRANPLAGEVAAMDLCSCDISEAVAQAFRLSRLVVAAPTYDASIFPPMAQFLHHLQLKNFRNRVVGIVDNGSWAPVAGKLMSDRLCALPGISVVEPRVTIPSRPTAATLEQISLLAQAISAHR